MHNLAGAALWWDDRMCQKLPAKSVHHSPSPALRQSQHSKMTSPNKEGKEPSSVFSAAPSTYQPYNLEYQPFSFLLTTLPPAPHITTNTAAAAAEDLLDLTSDNPPSIHHIPSIRDLSPSSEMSLCCAKCGSTDHVASNRNCPRSRKPSAAAQPRSNAQTTPLAPASKKLRDAKEGEATRYWYYANSTEEDPGSGEPKQTGNDDWKMSDPALRAAFGMKDLADKEPGDAESGAGHGEKKPNVKKEKPSAVSKRKPKKESTPVTDRRSVPKRRRAVKSDVMTTTKRKSIAKKAATKHAEKDKTPVGGGTASTGKPPESNGQKDSLDEQGISVPRHDKKTRLGESKTSGEMVGNQEDSHMANYDDESSGLSELESDFDLESPSASTKSLKGDKKREGSPRIKNTSDAKRIKNSDLVLTNEYAEWLDKPENDPYKNWKGVREKDFEYMGSRNKTIGPGRVRYQRNVQGWRDSRSEGGGLGHPFPGGPHPGTW
ncbi:hypothetical protein FN846DRAFT_929600 [Sphaerosporella brunnea]|uniref:Uncharacterized protein n=1 Tax=Sphaerosporella brunnea TaxID=1250544 RepID=A0A5J5F862_9PEZI|nr:hypothetical protein FN846DRAFT_929600 [Sphaerosporella brunnea]